MPNPEVATYYPRGVNNYVANMQYHSSVNSQGEVQAQITSPIAINATGVFNAVSIATALVGYNTYATTYTSAMQSPNPGGGLATFGRALSLVASAAYVGVVTIHGRDYLGQPMSESITANGTTPVNGKKAFMFVDSMDVPTLAAATTISVGWLDIFGLPFVIRALDIETVNGVATANAGTVVTRNALAVMTLTGADPRGTYAPNAANASNGTNSYQLLFFTDKNNLYGIQHIY